MQSINSNAGAIIGMSTPLLVISRATKTYGGAPALIDASLELFGGEVHALMGENGAGKSTLIKLLAGVITPDAMQLEMQGQPIFIHNPQDAFRHGLRFIHQELNVVPQLSVAENIFLSQPYPTYAGIFVNWRKLEQAARTTLNQLGISHINPREIIARLKPGDQMLVKIASAFVGAEQSKAFIYVLDEPTAALTGEETTLLFNVIRRLREQGCAIVYVSHRMEEIFKISDRITVMRDGRIIETNSTSDTTPADLIRLMTGRKLEQVYPPREAIPTETVLLDAHNLCTRTVKQVTFQLHVGEILGIAGLNGSGRSEMLRALMGVDKLSAGQIRLEGTRQINVSPAKAWENGFAFIPEERRSQGLILGHSVSSNVMLPHLSTLSWRGLTLNRRREQRISSQLGERVKLRAQSYHQRARELSGGNQQKILFARALACSARILLLDEPTRGIDVGSKYDIYQLIRHISSEGNGIIMVSSELSELIGLCDRILVMHQGQLVEIVDAAGQTEETLLALCYREIHRDN
ncbi:MAG: ATP-binding cassette domain-containing protein [Anaerolineaceae bacterium]|nr:ATP-binding cassette domain-containing protein [Anaerolineaceae bacterium]